MLPKLSFFLTVGVNCSYEKPKAFLFESGHLR